MRRMRNHWASALSVLGACSTLVTTLSAQTAYPEEPAFITLGMEAGLSQGSIYALHQDPAGLIWIGTQDGLNRFDGVSFRVFRHSPTDDSSLSDDLILSLADGPGGALWVGTERGGLSLFYPATGRSERFEMPELGPWQLDAEGTEGPRRGRAVHSILPLDDGSVVVSTDAGLAHLNQSSNTVRELAIEVEGARPNGSVPFCRLTTEGGLGAFSDRTVRRIDGSYEFPIILEAPAEITSLRCPGAGPGILSTGEGEIFAFDSESARLEVIAEFRNGGDAIPDINDVLMDPRGLLWIATQQGLFLKAGQQPMRQVGANTDGRGLPGNRIEHLYLDATGVLWIGTWNGLSRLHPRSFQIRRVMTSQGGRPGIPGNGVISIESSPEGGYWLGTMGAGVRRLGSAWRTTGAALPPLDALDPWSSSWIFGLDVDRDGNLWGAAGPEGFMVLDHRTGVASSVPIRRLDGDQVQDSSAYSVFVDGQGTVWAGSGEVGLLRFDPTTDAFEEYRGPEGDWSYGSSWVWPIAEDSLGNLWVGAFNGHVTRIDPNRETIRSWGTEPGELSDNRILSLFPDSRGDVWIGTQGGGLNRLSPTADEIFVYTSADGLPHDHVEGITEDEAGFLWLTTNEGLARFDPDEEEFWVLNEGSGLAGNRFFANSVFKNESGLLLFGGPNGITVLDPAEIRPDTTPPPVALTGFQVRGQAIPLPVDSLTGRIHLRPDQNFFAFEFAALDYTDPTQNQYRYKLEGLNEGWIDAGSNQIANYTSVPPGRYEFLVRARNADGVWNEDGLRIPIRVFPPYYRTWWFRTALFLALGGMFYAVYRFRLSELRRRQRMRLDLAGDLHDDVGGNLATIVRKAHRVERALPSEFPFQKELERVGTLARETDFKVREVVWTVREKYDTLGALISKMKDTAELLLGENVGYDFNAPDHSAERKVRWEIRKDVYLLFKEALNNIVKHSEAKHAEIGISYDPPFLSVRIHDNGKGFDTDATSGGQGLSLMEKHVESYGGGSPVTSVVGGGTTVKLKVKIG